MILQSGIEVDKKVWVGQTQNIDQKIQGFKYSTKKFYNNLKVLSNSNYGTIF